VEKIYLYTTPSGYKNSAQPASFYHEKIFCVLFGTIWLLQTSLSPQRLCQQLAPLSVKSPSSVANQLAGLGLFQT